MISRIRWMGVAAIALAVAFASTEGASGQTTHQHKDSGNYVVKRAFSHVESIRDELQRNVNEYGGHRLKAIEHLTAALEELNQALWADAPAR